ncbi:hypothetical protein, partial [Varibaculum cambriense]|uniref:hypothetical protein n=1 Tax=Varibaculum cambriense TaxID=184870 RepID=UPI002900C7E6
LRLLPQVSAISANRLQFRLSSVAIKTHVCRIQEYITLLKIPPHLHTVFTGAAYDFRSKRVSAIPFGLAMLKTSEKAFMRRELNSAVVASGREDSSRRLKGNSWKE